MILCLRGASLQQLHGQRTLDRCLYPALLSRCSTYTKLAGSNQKLRLMIHLLVVMKAAQKAAATNPYTAAAAAALQAEIAAMKAAAKALTQYQDALIKIEMVTAAAIVRCGAPLRGMRSPGFERPFSLEAQLAEVPAPLDWSGEANDSEFEVRSWKKLRLKSFGHCQTSASPKLDGEEYAERFTHAPAGSASPPSKSSFL